MAEADDVVEQTLHISRSVDLFSIPPRPPTGWKSGEWLVSSKIFTGRLRVVSIELDCEIRIEDPHTGGLYVTCPVSHGKRNLCVEAVTDSSRYYVLRVEDPQTKRHKFIGMGFAERGDAFDFNDALIRHEKFVERDKACSQLASLTTSDDNNNSNTGTEAVQSQQQQQQQPSKPGMIQPQAATPPSAFAVKEASALYTHHTNLSLKEGQTIHVNLKPTKSGGTHAANGASWLNSGNAAAASPVITPVATPGGLFKLAPPPGDTSTQETVASPKSSFGQQHEASSNMTQVNTLPVTPAIQQQHKDLLGFDDVPAFSPAAAKAPSQASAQPPTPIDNSWAVFD